jgi:hypothetical protein
MTCLVHFTIVDDFVTARALGLHMLHLVAMERQIEEWANDTGEERTDFFASNWLTGNDWKMIANGVFEPLYEACLDYHENPVEYAGWMFG